MQKKIKDSHLKGSYHMTFSPPPLTSTGCHTLLWSTSLFPHSPLYFPFAFLLILSPMGFQVHFFLDPSLLLVPSIIQNYKVISGFIKPTSQPIFTDFSLLGFYPPLVLFKVNLFLPVSAHELYKK